VQTGKTVTSARGGHDSVTDGARKSKVPSVHVPMS
jgi:hypothetical protein